MAKRPTIGSGLRSKPMERDNGTTLQREEQPSTIPNEIPNEVLPQADDKAGYKVRRARLMKPHVSLYLDPRVIHLMKDIAHARGVKAHDVYLDALRAFLRTQGHDLDAING